MKKKIFSIFLVSMMVGSLFTPLHGINKVYAKETKVVTQSAEDYLTKTKALLEENSDTMRYVVKDEEGNWNEATLDGYNKDGQRQVKEGETWVTSIYELFNRGIVVNIGGDNVLSTDMDDAQEKWYSHNHTSSSYTSYTGNIRDKSRCVDFPELYGFTNMSSWVGFDYLNIEFGGWSKIGSPQFSYCNLIVTEANHVANIMQLIGEEESSSITIVDDTSWNNLIGLRVSDVTILKEAYKLKSSTKQFTDLHIIKDMYGNYVKNTDILKIIDQETYNGLKRMTLVATSLDEVKNMLESDVQKEIGSTTEKLRMRIVYTMTAEEIRNAEVDSITGVDFDVLLDSASSAVMKNGIYEVTTIGNKDYPSIGYSVNYKIADNAIKVSKVEVLNAKVDMNTMELVSFGQYGVGKFPTVSEKITILSSDGLTVTNSDAEFLIGQTSGGVTNKGYTSNINITNVGGIGYIVMNAGDDNEVYPKGIGDEESRSKYQTVETEDGSTLLVKEQNNGYYNTVEPLEGVGAEAKYDAIYVRDVVEGKPVYKEEIKGYEDKEGNIYYPNGKGGFIEQDKGGTVTLPDGTVIEGNEETGEKPKVDIDNGKITITIPEGGTVTDSKGESTEYPNGGVIDDTGKVENIVIDVKEGSFVITEDNGKLVISKDGEVIYTVDKDTIIDVKDSSKGTTDNKVVIKDSDVTFGNINADTEIINESNVTVTGDISGNVTGDVINKGGNTNVGGEIGGETETTNGGSTNANTSFSMNTITDIQTVIGNRYDIALTVDGKAITMEQLQHVTWEVEVLGGFPEEASNYITLDTTTASMSLLKSSVIKVMVIYEGKKASHIVVKPGDVDKNGRLTRIDVVKLVDYFNAKDKELTIFHENTMYLEHLMDMDGNGRLTRIDIVMLTDVLNEGGSK